MSSGNFKRANGLEQFYSQMSGGKLEVFIDPWGDPTINYPHVHLVFRGDETSPNRAVDIIASMSATNHPWRTTLSHPDGNEVYAAATHARNVLVELMRKQMEEKRRLLAFQEAVEIIINRPRTAEEFDELRNGEHITRHYSYDEVIAWAARIKSGKT